MPLYYRILWVLYYIVFQCTQREDDLLWSSMQPSLLLLSRICAINVLCSMFFAGILLILGCYMYTERVSAVVVEGDIWRIRVPPPTHTGKKLDEGMLLFAYVCCICEGVLC
jgi:hypothetical protein